MSIELFISHSVPVLSPNDTVSRALEILEDNKIGGLAVVADDEYLGLVTDSGLSEVEDSEVSLLDSGLLRFKPAISSQAHPLEGISIVHQAKLPLLPVLDTDQKFLGCVTRDDLVNYIAENSGISNPGGILVLEILPRNYSLYEIARICENEDVIMLAMHSRTNERGMLEITMKLNRTVLDAVVSSFERHNYHVLEVYGKETNNEDILGKYNLLMNYINM
jgi:acetoin utilization protein AcuB